ncbi:class 1 fructose-bisphosphatase [Roseibium sp. ROS1]|jgi:fructose-1,6-bisphosphatase I|uniref:class 1 fructose-bisphosphatase n=1 Tax=Labrenzia sp. THAF35 TaxID=2587854 RepID=UPI0012687A5F|nr:class 1 fructose-bisphosphatase [Labrenzia sp. THAF35]MCR9285227.1 class 1 fructose-bisphosphatase [Paracoccaceae bacterium]QFT70965.1 Fructose-1,6-bisphosphatase class 1 [Labrenzia sp. THAF35]
MLRLPNDTDVNAETLQAYLARQHGASDTAAVLQAIADATGVLADRLAAGRLPGDPGEVVGTNESGDKQKALDVGAHLHMVEVLRAAGVRQLLSEEAEEIILLNPEGTLDVAIDPIDGSGSIGTGAPLGTLFSILPASDQGFLCTGRSVIAAGYVSFGHSTDLGFSLGNGLHLAVFDRAAGVFRMLRENHQVPAKSRTLAFNASNARHWPDAVRRFSDDVLKGKEGRLGENYNMRWLASAVGEFHRILLQGGLFFYPGDRRPGYENGRLRLVYEAVPIAFLIEQGGGKATDGQTPILDLMPESLHQNIPLIFGSPENVDMFITYCTDNT